MEKWIEESTIQEIDIDIRIASNVLEALRDTIPPQYMPGAKREITNALMRLENARDLLGTKINEDSIRDHMTGLLASIISMRDTETNLARIPQWNELIEGWKKKINGV